VKRRTIADLSVSAIALGGASWSLTDLPDWPDDDRAGRGEEAGIATIHAAIEAGLTLIDSARAYTTATHPGHSEALIRRALASHPDGEGVVVASKGGHYRDGHNFPICGRPAALKRDCDASRALLAVDRIDLYQLHWPDPSVGIAASVEALAELREAGWVRHVGLSNVSVEQLEEALSIAPIASVQNHFSPLDQGDREMVEYCAERSIAYLAYTPLAGGTHGAGRTALHDAFPAAAAVAQRHEISIQRLALAWLLRLSPTLIPVCGASRAQTAVDSLRATELTLAEEEWAELDFASPG
jgi:aryl-alcohol dehydrogenase-like predicted oxidoreductase